MIHVITLREYLEAEMPTTFTHKTHGTPGSDHGCFGGVGLRIDRFDDTDNIGDGHARVCYCSGDMPE